MFNIHIDLILNDKNEINGEKNLRIGVKRIYSTKYGIEIEFRAFDLMAEWRTI